MADDTPNSPRRLGRGLSSLLPSAPRTDQAPNMPEPEASGAPNPHDPAQQERPTDRPPDQPADQSVDRDIRRLQIAHIRASALQPRRIFDAAEMQSLADSITERGVLQPILVRPIEHTDDFEIVAGERRWRAAQMAGLHEIPALIRALDDRATLEFALIENLQRDSLTDLEEAQGFQRLIEQFGHTQEDVAKTVGKSRSHVANTLRLLAVPESIKAMLDAGELTAGHARALLSAKDPESMAQKIVAKNLSVREVERLVAKESTTSASKGQRTSPSMPAKDANILDLERQLENATGLSVDIKYDGQIGTVRFEYRSLDQLDELIAQLLRERSNS